MRIQANSTSGCATSVAAIEAVPVLCRPFLARGVGRQSRP